MKKALVLLAVCAFTVNLLGFIGCGGIEEDPDAKANEANQEKFGVEIGSPDDIRTNDDETSKGNFGNFGKDAPDPEKKD